MPDPPCTYVTTGVPCVDAAYASASACMCASRPTNVVVTLGIVDGAGCASARGAELAPNSEDVVGEGTSLR